MKKKKNYQSIKLKLVQFIKAMFIGLFFLLGLSSTFIHINYAKLAEWNPYKNHNLVYKNIIKDSNNEMDKLVEGLKKEGQFHLAKQIEIIENTKQEKLKDFHSKRNDLIKEYSYFGYPSLRMFLYEVGRSIFSLLPTLLLVIFLNSPKLMFRYKTFFIIGAVGLVYVSLFWVVHSLFIKSDYPMDAYIFSYVFSALVATIVVISVVYLMGKLEKRKQKTQKELEQLVTNGEELIKLLKQR